MKHPVNFVYALFAITLIGGGASMYVLQNAFENLTISSVTLAEIDSSNK